MKCHFHTEDRILLQDPPATKEFEPLPRPSTPPTAALQLMPPGNSTPSSSKGAGGVCEESPLKGYRRVLARNGGRWVLQFVSPEGLRFDSQESLATHVCGQRPDIDLRDWDKLDLHFLRQHHHTSSEENCRRAKVQFTFCSMRQNIFDLRHPKKRKKVAASGRDNRRNSTAASWVPHQLPTVPVENVPEPLDTIRDISTIHTESSAKDTPAVKKSNTAERTESCDESLLLCSSRSIPEQTGDLPHQGLDTADLEEETAVVDKPLSFVEEFNSTIDQVATTPQRLHEERPLSAMTSRSSLSSSRCELLNEDDEIQLKVPVQECNVAVTDLFTSRLDMLRCVGCSGLHSAALGDRVTIDLKDQTILLVCRECSWWSCRKITTRHRHETSSSENLVTGCVQHDQPAS